ncbi:MAG: hypothetical protein ACLU99_13710 [Alphaproteobacteria bacterium]
MTILTTIAFITSVLLSANTALAASVANPHFTPMSLSPEPASVNLSYEVAGVYWLPDYLKGNISRGSEDPGGGDIDTGCGYTACLTIVNRRARPEASFIRCRG